MTTAADIIRLLDLKPHPVEGGYFRETHRTAEFVPAALLPAHGAIRSVGTAIYYLLTGGAVSEMHRLPGDEVYHFYAGDPLVTLLLFPDRSGRAVTLGTDFAAGQVPQLVIPGGVWQGSVRADGPHGWTLIGATMAPGFDYADYTRGERSELSAEWAEFAADISSRTPNG